MENNFEDYLNKDYFKEKNKEENKSSYNDKKEKYHKFDNIDKIIEKLKKSLPLIESMSLEEKADSYLSEATTAEIVNNMIINAYAHISKKDYQSAKKQLDILKSVDLPNVLDGDNKSIENTKTAVLGLEKRLEPNLI